MRKILSIFIFSRLQKNLRHKIFFLNEHKLFLVYILRNVCEKSFELEPDFQLKPREKQNWRKCLEMEHVWQKHRPTWKEVKERSILLFNRKLENRPWCGYLRESDTITWYQWIIYVGWRNNLRYIYYIGHFNHYLYRNLFIRRGHADEIFTVEY